MSDSLPNAQANATKNTGPMVTCPSCHKQHQYDSSNAFRPFCSARCKIADFHAWSEDQYSIAGEKISDSDSSKHHNNDEDTGFND